MLRLVGPILDLVLFCPCESLRKQLDVYTQDGRTFRVRATEIDGAAEATVAATAAVIDATEDPSGAEGAMELVLEQIGPSRTLLYTERSLPELEILARVSGVMFVLGPLDPMEWDASLAHLAGMSRKLGRSGPHLTAPPGTLQ